MALAFSRNMIADYAELYERLDRLKNQVVGYGGTLADSAQDHFTPRSRLFADAILAQASSTSFKRVLLRFHKEVSTFRICRFDVFRRRAFDAKFAEKAFRHWQEGMEFYQQQYQHDSSPYLKQQGALYLAHKRHFQEAFQWIDEAVSESQYRVPSIRNTHAIILFRANINAMEDEGGTKRDMLDRSMKILSDCHQNDLRKTYHAVTFSEQAVEYFDKYGDAKAYGYLDTSAKWLRDEARTNPWHRRVRKILRDVENKLRR